MKLLTRALPCLFVIAFLFGCASSHITDRHEYKGAKIARPNQIFVYDFAATSSDVPSDSALAGQYSDPTIAQTPEQIATGRQVGAEIAQNLVSEILSMGLSAVEVSGQASPKVGDLVIRGYILSLDEGNAAKRVAIGFGSGASHLKTAVEGFLMTENGLKKLGSGDDEVGGSKSPGTAVALAGAVATANPAGLIISSAMKAHGEMSGSSTIEGRAKQTAQEIAKILKKKFKEQGWI